MLSVILSFLGFCLSASPYLIDISANQSAVTYFPLLGLGTFAVLLLSNILDYLSQKKMRLNIASYQEQIKQLNQDLSRSHESFDSLEAKLMGLRRKQGLNEELRTTIKDLQLELKHKQQELDQQNRQREKLEQQINGMAKQSGEGDLISLLSSLQKKGRFLDFIMGDISAYPDQQVGAAARVVHQGCKEAMKDFVHLEPIHQDEEGSTIQLAESEQDLMYDFSGSVQETPKSGRLLHKGWRTKHISLPERTRKLNPNNLVITPAEVEL